MTHTMPPGAALLLGFIREAEVGRRDRASYEVIYAHRQNCLKKPLTAMTLGEVIAAQKTWSKSHGSSAAGGYQFMRATLIGLLRDVPWLEEDQFLEPGLQDRLGLHLLNRRGFASFLAGEITLAEFGRRLAMEWASLPVLAESDGDRRRVKRGQSYYAGDGLNRALVKPDKVEAVLRQVFSAARPADATPGPAEDVPAAIARPEGRRKPVARSGRFWTWLLTAGGTIITALKELNLVALDWRVQLAILTTIVGFAGYAISSMPAVRDALGLGR
ncbi:glycoside hydrolase family 104 protein [Sinorhizobium americanum]|uniref:Muramidase (Phage lysozyme) n=1 Tax=Sinorhizobium americanum TaxID=194963 RepID=A0A4V2REK9_9HYPH|nr:glycoside hydrolase family 104 protein [Sinorhizobium americanum]TCN29100.1 muramidase (phage lysozyme) [Sinorhizobium americanum]